MIAAVALAMVYRFNARESAELQFRPRNFPPGTRELVLQQGVSPLSAVLAGPQLDRDGEQIRPDPAQICRALFRDVSSPASGAVDRPVEIITFLDYRCPYCKTLSGIISGLQNENARFVYREWAILGEASMLAARAALAADRQGKYLAFHDRLMKTRLIPTPDLIDVIATDLGLDVKKLHADMKSDATTQSLRQTSALASALGLIGTPALVVGRTVVQGDVTRRQLEKLIANERSLPPMKDC